MARQIKDKYIGGRVDQDYFDKVLTYIDAANLTQGELVRAAVEDYMASHVVGAKV